MIKGNNVFLSVIEFAAKDPAIGIEAALQYPRNKSHLGILGSLFLSQLLGHLVEFLDRCRRLVRIEAGFFHLLLVVVETAEVCIERNSINFSSPGRLQPALLDELILGYPVPLRSISQLS